MRTNSILRRVWLPTLTAIVVFHPGRAKGQVQAVDQSYVEGGQTVFAINDPHSRAQTFTVGAAGTLTRVDLGVWHYPTVGPTEVLTVAILPTSATGVPLHNQPLAAFSLTPADVADDRG